MMGEIITLACYGGREGTMSFRRPRGIDEMATYCAGNSIWFMGNDGTARRAKVNGRVRRWKRSPDRIEVPVKYGLYEYATLTAADINRVLIPVATSGQTAVELAYDRYANGGV